MADKVCVKLVRVFSITPKEVVLGAKYFAFVIFCLLSFSFKKTCVKFSHMLVLMAMDIPK